MPSPNARSTESADKIVFHNGPPPSDATEQEKAISMEGTAHGITLPNEEDVLVGVPGCQHCEVLPKPLRGPGTVSLRFPHTYSLGKILSYITTTDWEHSEHDGTLSVRIPEGSLAPLLSAASQRIVQKVFVNFSPDSIYNPNSCQIPAWTAPSVRSMTRACAEIRSCSKSSKATGCPNASLETHRGLLP